MVVQGDTSGCSQGSVDSKTKVSFQYTESILNATLILKLTKPRAQPEVVALYLTLLAHMNVDVMRSSNILLNVLLFLQRPRAVRGPLPRRRSPHRRARAQDALQGQEEVRLRGRRRQDQGELVVNNHRPRMRWPCEVARRPRKPFKVPSTTTTMMMKNLKNNQKSQKRVTCCRLTAFSGRLGTVT